MCAYKSGLIPLGWVTRESIDFKTHNLTIKYVLFWITPFENTCLDASVLQSLELELFWVFFTSTEKGDAHQKGYSSFLLSRKSNRNWNQTVGNQSNQKLWFYAHILENISQKSHYTLKWPAYYEFPFCFLLFFPSHHIFADLFSFFFSPHLYFILLCCCPSISPFSQFALLFSTESELVTLPIYVLAKEVLLKREKKKTTKNKDYSGVSVKTFKA